MSLDTTEIRQILEEACKALAEAQGAALAHPIQPILLANLDRGRLAACQGDPILIQDYVRRVADNFAELHGYLRQLQVDKSHEVWEPLYGRMQTWAFNFFVRKGFSPDASTRDIAFECASDAATALLRAHFPYDAEFDAWAHTIVLNICRKYMQKNLGARILEEMSGELDDELPDPNAPLLGREALRSEFGEDLEFALDQLSEARKAVILAIICDEEEPEEVARRLGKSVGAIYTLQFHGLRELRKILTLVRDNLNE